MPLESLYDLVQELRERIDKHGDALRTSESLTRYALIDPLLRELGWDTGDPDQVRPEYSLRTEYTKGTPSVDYALLPNRSSVVAEAYRLESPSPVMMVEAKKLGTPLRDQVLLQGVSYCNLTRTRYFTVTDGRLWELYDTQRSGDIDDKRVLEFDLNAPNVAKTCLKTLALWRPSLRSGEINIGEPPVVTRGGQNGDGPDNGELPPDWQPLAAVIVEQGQKPVEMLFPDNGRASMKGWRSAPVETVRWLMNNGMMSADNCPIMPKSGRARRYMVNREPVHSNGNPFRSSAEVNGLYIELDHSLSGLREMTKTIIEHVGQDPAQFKVRFPLES